MLKQKFVCLLFVTNCMLLASDTSRQPQKGAEPRPLTVQEAVLRSSVKRALPTTPPAQETASLAEIINPQPTAAGQAASNNSGLLQHLSSRAQLIDPFDTPNEWCPHHDRSEVCGACAAPDFSSWDYSRDGND